MLTAHRVLGARVGEYGDGWEIIGDDLEVVARVTTEEEARRIAREQRVPAHLKIKAKRTKERTRP